MGSWLCHRPAAWPQVRAPWYRGGHEAVDVVGPVAPPGRADGREDARVYTDWLEWPLGAVLGHLCTLLRRCGQAWGYKSVHRSEKMTSRSRFGAFVYTAATRAASGGTSAPTTMVRRRYLLGGRLSHGREDRIRVSGVAAGLASSPRQQPTQTPEEPNKCGEQGLGLTRLPRRLATRLLPRGEQHLLPADAHGPSQRGPPPHAWLPPPHARRDSDDRTRCSVPRA